MKSPTTKLERLRERIIRREEELRVNTEWRTRLSVARACEEYGKALPLIDEQGKDVALYRRLAGLPPHARLDFLIPGARVES